MLSINHARTFSYLCALASLVFAVEVVVAAGLEQTSKTIASPFTIEVNALAEEGRTAVSYDPFTGYHQLQELFVERKPFRMANFPLGANRSASLVLRPVEVMEEGATVIAVKETGTVRLVPRVVTFEGHLSDDPASRVFLALSPTMVNGYVAQGGELLYLSSGEPKRIVPGRAMIGAANTIVPDLVQGHEDYRVIPDEHREPIPAESVVDERGLRTAPQLRIADLFIEGDDEFTAQFDTAQDAADYIVTVVAAVSTFYRRDLGVELRIPDGYIRVWETTPPWLFPDLNYFTDYWISPDNPLRDIDRSSVHLMSSVYAAGVAWLGGLCRSDYGYSLGGSQGFFPIPVQHVHPDNGDLWMFAHEIGHIFGAYHTFDFNPPIDCLDGSGPDEGTIMSYCFPDLGLRFHARVQELIRTRLTGFECLELLNPAPGDYNHDGLLDTLDLEAASMCINLEFAAAGCLDTFDLNDDGRLTPCDYDALAHLVDPFQPIPDCNGNFINDCDEITAGTEEDCNANGVPDACDIAGASIADCNGNNIPDDCEDCNGNGLADECDLAAGTSPDCQSNGVPDECDIAGGTSEDFNANTVPDECDPHQGTIYVSITDPNCSSAGPGTEQSPFCNIQDAIDAALSTDVIIVADGTYTGERNRQLDFGGRTIVLRSANGPQNCVIDLEGEGRAFHFHNGETPAARLDGLTIINGYIGVFSGCGFTGAGIYCEVSSPTIANCVIADNTAYSTCSTSGGGIGLEKSSAHITGCTIVGNTATNGGGGAVSSMDSDPVISSCVLVGNAARSGGGLWWAVTSGGEFMGYYPTIRHCTIVGNTVTYRGGGVYSVANGDPRITNSIVWYNTSESLSYNQIYKSGSLTVSYSAVQNGWTGQGNISANPLFVDRNGPDGIPNTLDDDLHLAIGSPCINAGDPAYVPEPGETDVDGDTRWHSTRIDIGADETPWPRWDGDHDGDVDLADFAVFADCLAGPGATPAPQLPLLSPACRMAFDLDADQDIDLIDFAALQAALSAP